MLLGKKSKQQPPDSNDYYRPYDAADVVEPQDVVGSQPITPGEILGQSDEPEIDMPQHVAVMVENKFVRIVPKAARRGQVGRVQIGGSGQQPVAQIIAGHEMRRSITLLNTSSVTVEYGYSFNLSPGNGFPLAAGAAVSLPYSGSIYACLAPGETGPGEIAFDALFDDG